MKTYELTLAGYSPLSGETDHLVLWVKALDLTAVDRYVRAEGLSLSEPPRYLDGRDDQITPQEVDAVLTD